MSDNAVILPLVSRHRLKLVMATIPKMPESVLLDSMQEELDLAGAEKIQVAEAYGEAGVDGTLGPDEVMRLLKRVLDGLTRKEATTQVCDPKYAEEYGGENFVHCFGLADGR